MERSPLARYGTGILWIFAGVMHFVIPRAYEAILPPSLRRWKREIVYISGVAELAGGLAVLPERTRRPARWWLLATLVAVYPANVHMALHPDEYKRIPPALLWARLPLQALFGLGIWRGTR
ncbi:MAG TPA: hypothetical protein VI111_06860 [Thermoleophilaceae bacterium]